MEQVKKGRYIIVTPVKNEESYIGYLLDSMLDQSVRPLLWIIVDDGCTDRTMELVKERMADHPWIISLELEKGEWDLGIHYADICIRGIDHAISYCRTKGQDWDFVGVVDGDIRLAPDYFERLLGIFGRDERLGIASGVLYDVESRVRLNRILGANLPMGGARLWRRECYEVAPYQHVYAPDSVSNIKAGLNGWTTSIIRDATAFQMRSMGSKMGMCPGAVLWGKSSYFLGSPPFFALLKGLKIMLKHSFIPGLCFWKGYFTFMIKNEATIEDDEILHHYRKKRFHELIRSYLWKH